MTNDIAATNADLITAMETVFGNRIKAPAESGKWIIWRATVSPQTLDKFVRRAKDAGIRGVWARDGKVGCASV